ncbi:MAG: AP endonuclease [Desulfuromonas sp.]|nr:MAG: AP endonuclease [Desulfuromonas sp.]
MSPNLFVHVPYGRLEQSLPYLLEKGLQPEVAFLGEDLDGLQHDVAARLGAELNRAGLQVTIHGPFHDLNSGALDPAVRQVTARRYRQVLEAGRLLGAKLIVLHPGYEHWRYGGVPNLWLQPNFSFWPPLLDEAQRHGQIIALENIFETDPDTLVALLDRLDHPCLGHCFDIGHWNLFAKTDLAGWFSQLGHRMVHLHLHDNRGDADSHLPIGQGNIDIESVFKLAGRLDRRPSMTLEAHTRPELEDSLAAFPDFLRFLN